MLRLSNIKKDYKVADQMVPALKGISISFRKNEFVSILGPSGCGKTTTLNIIGGLDKYTNGDLFINGVSTKEFKDRDWDVYRNHRVGFIFQSYNLIPHQTVLGNVELALTIAGLSKAERIQRSKDALDKVGLAGEYYKRPNQLSGGQCQRVAIARALVNNPEILLADEPTGALDTQTSIQIMELIKEISKEKLVIMVTHNPELAEKYSSRIVRLLDGELQSDSNPFSEEDEIKEVEETLRIAKEEEEKEYALLTEKEIKVSKKRKKENAKMSFWTAFKLSFRNLRSKLKRTIMVIVAGSIGIIGVSTVLAVSTGVKGYIATMQDDMLSGNPIQISETGFDYASMMDQSSFNDKREALEKGDWVNVNSMIQYLVGNQDVLMNLMYNNEFDKNYVDYIKSMPKEYYNAIALNYGIDVTQNIFTNFEVTNEKNDKDEYLYPEKANYNKEMSLQAITETYTGLIGELPEYKKYASIITSLTAIMSQCIPNNDYISSQYDLVYGDLPINKNDVIIVLDDESQMTDLMLTQLGYYTQDEFFNLIYKVTEEDKFTEALYKTKFTYDELMEKKFTWYPNDTVYTETGIDASPFTYNHIAGNDWQTGIDLNICGIVKPKKGVSYGALSTGLLYSEDLAREIIKQNSQSKLVNYMNENKEFGLDTKTPENSKYITYNLEYYFEREDNTYAQVKPFCIVGTDNQMLSMMSSMFSEEETDSSIYRTITIRSTGGNYTPSSISIYPLDFARKDLVTDYLDKWNGEESLTFTKFDDNFNKIGETTLTAEQRNEIKYADNVELIINMINTMINIITYALVAFTALSLVVSTVMVGIITYVSVVERVKEIGVIRSLGGRKKDVSHLFNAETFMIGLSSGVFGIVVTVLISLFVNVLIKSVSDGMVSKMADLTAPTAIVMILLSIVLTLISGLIPAKAAARKDPVNALRSE